jgi:hypothetical protein
MQRTPTREASPLTRLAGLWHLPTASERRGGADVMAARGRKGLLRGGLCLVGGGHDL